MANRPTTAEILAAARAAANRPSTPKESASNGVALAEHRPETLEAVSRGEETRGGGETPERMLTQAARATEGSNGASPPRMQEILAEVRSSSSSSESWRGESAPPSVAAILAEVRRICGTMPTESINTADAVQRANASPPTPKRRPSTAEILAAARNQGASSGLAASSATAPSGDTRPRTTAEILAAARRQGGATASSASVASSKRARTLGASSPAKKGERLQGDVPARTPTPVRTTTVPPGGDAVNPGVVDDAKPRPKPIDELLADVRANATARTVVDADLPSLPEMIAALRRLDEQRQARRNGRAGESGWRALLRRWLGHGTETRHGASI
jgi:hypothetical protein